MKRVIFPFVAIMGQEKLKKALTLNIINPKIGGVLICGEKGTAKSTAVRGIGELLKHVKVIDLPLNITEDRLIGSIDIEKAISEGEKEIEYGLLKKAHGNILYIDEVNLLSEHIVNSILSVAASGENSIEREGFSSVHQCEFILVGTMNPEEGPLRSAFLDRFGLYVEVEGNKDLNQRVELLKRRLDFERNPMEFKEIWAHDEEILLEQIESAKKLIKKMIVKEQALHIAAQFSSRANCNGHRGEIVIIEAAKAIAALDGRDYINIEDLKEASELALPHRIKEGSTQKEEKNEVGPEEDVNDSSEENNEKNSQNEPHKAVNENNGGNAEGGLEDSISEQDFEENADEEESKNETTENEDMSQEDNFSSENYDDEVFDIGNIFKVKDLKIKIMDRKKRQGAGKRLKSKTTINDGRYVKYKSCNGKIKDLAFDATIRAAAPYQNLRRKDEVAISIHKSDIKEKVREKRTGATILFTVDASSSMGVNKRMEAVKGAILSLLTDAYEKRDKVGLIAFRKNSAEILLNITRSVELAQKELKYMATGGRTPLASGLKKAYELLEIISKKDSDMVPLLVVISDGRANYEENGNEPFSEALKISSKIREKNIQSIVIDCEDGFIKLKMAKELSDALGGEYCKIDDLTGNNIANMVREHM